MVQPKPAASSISWRTCDPITSSFFGTQPRMTQVPPTRYSSAIITRAPWPAAMRAARTPPEPAPITRRSTSCAAITTPALAVGRAARHVDAVSQIVTLLLHLGLEPRHDLLADLSRPGFRARQALVDHDRLLGGEFLADGRLVEREHVLELRLGEFRRVQARNLIDDLVAPRRH